MHTRTDSRWNQVRELSPFILEMLPMKEADRNATNGLREMTIEGEVYDEFTDPIEIMAQNVYESMAGYDNHYHITPDIDYLSISIPSLKKENKLF